MTAPILLSALLSLACGRGGPPEGHTPGDGGAGTDDTGVTDGGSTSGTGILGIQGLRGEGQVSRVGPDWTFAGTEEAWYQSADGSVTWCSVLSSLETYDAGVPACDGCEWSFSLRTYGSVATGACAADAADWDGATFSYGYALDKYGYGVLAYYYQGYGWYGTYGTITWEPGSGAFQYEWPLSYFYYYAG
ncbi:hypothetical protein L6R53_23630 [Myxococcota bacterium]|nr:hypothetical protein [Myxococcota bacterium]